MNNFLMIKNSLFTLFNSIDTLGFTILTYIIYMQDNGVTTLSPSTITSFLPFIKDKRTVCKYLYKLQCTNLISSDADFLSIKKNQVIIINLSPYLNLANGFEPIPIPLFTDNIACIKDIGWSVFCYLAKMHNTSFGSNTCLGYTYVSEETIAKNLNIHRNSVSKYIFILEKQHLIKILFKKNILNGFDITDQYSYTPNRYKVLYKTKE